jgi:lipopolysaccharide transport system permease protein
MPFVNDGGRSRVRYRISSASPRLWTQVGEALANRDLFGILLSKELRVRYKQTALGATWVVLQPLIPALIFAFVFGNFARLPSGGTPYLAFALSGLVVYMLVATTANRAGTSLIRDGQLLTKVYIPRALVPVSAGAASMIDFAVGLILVIAVGLGVGVQPTAALLLAPVVGIGALTLGLGVGLAVAAVSARYRDVAIALPFATQVLLYASPIVYSVELVPAGLRDLYALNPMVGLVEAFRWTVLGTPPPSLLHLALGLAVGTVATIGGLMIFERFSRDLTDVI